MFLIDGFGSELTGNRIFNWVVVLKHVITSKQNTICNIMITCNIILSNVIIIKFGTLFNSE